MAITPLPQATVHLLGSAQALTTPTSLVKELVDNALDAKALFIDILISSNTIDKIEVRDNGHGIQQEDLDALGRRGHTSKLRSFDELKSIGGVSLGFRGEALASAVQLGEVTVTTRTEGESVATAVKLKAPGGIDSQSRTSHPIGTTVCVTKFMYKLPVRKQTFLKESSKTVAKIKELLQAYALARPSTKFSFKVLKESKRSWSYAPRPNDGIKEAVSQIIGKEAASQCISKSLRFSERSYDVDDTSRLITNSQISQASSELKSNDFIVEVFLPKRDADTSKIEHGQYISVDSRPVSHEKNTMKKIVTIFKYYLKGTFSTASENTKSPFLRLNITCPIGSYDPNVEPAKNDVIFGNESVVLEAVENLFKEVYGAPETISSVAPQQSLKEKLDNFETLLARKPAAPPAADSSFSLPSDSMTVQAPETAFSKNPPVPLSTSNNSAISEGSTAVDNQEIDEPVDSSKHKWAFDMSKDLSAEVEGFEWPNNQSKHSYNAHIPDFDMEPHPRNSLNPWIIAKMNAPVQQRDQLTNTEAGVSFPVSWPARDAVPTPQHSSDPDPFDSDIHVQSTCRNRPRQTIRNGDIRNLVVPSVQNFPFQRLDPGSIQRTNLEPSRRPLTSDGDDEVLVEKDDSGTQRRKNDFVSARNISDAALLSPPATLGPKRPRRAVNKSFVSPMSHVETAASHDGMRQMKLITDYRASRGCNTILQDQTEQQANSDLDWSMDFEHRKEVATRRRRDELRATALEVANSVTQEVVRTSPHKNRYNAAITTLQAHHPSPSKAETVKQPLRISMPDGDPRAYLMRRQKSVMGQKAKSGEAPKMTRAKSNRLPLENVPENEKTHDLMLELSVDMSSLQRITREVVKSDAYVRKGNESLGLLTGGLETTGIASRVQAVITKWIEREGKEHCVVEYMFENLVPA